MAANQAPPVAGSRNQRRPSNRGGRLFGDVRPTGMTANAQSQNQNTFSSSFDSTAFAQKSTTIFGSSGLFSPGLPATGNENVGLTTATPDSSHVPLLSPSSPCSKQCAAIDEDKEGVGKSSKEEMTLPDGVTSIAAERIVVLRKTTLTPSQFAVTSGIRVSLAESETGKSYYLYPELLKSESGYFKEWLGKADSIPPDIALPCIKDAAMDIVVDWIYGVALDIGVFRKVSSEKNPLCFATEIYAAARLLQMPGLENDLIDVLKLFLRSDGTRNITSNCLQECIDHNLKDTKLWLFYLRGYVCDICRNKLCRAAAISSTRNPDIDSALGLEMMHFLDKRYEHPRGETGCEYHNHTSDSFCVASHLT